MNPSLPESGEKHTRGPVAFVPYCFADCDNGVEGEYRWGEIDEKPFPMADPEHWRCQPIYAAAPAAAAPAAAAPAAAAPVAWRYRLQGAGPCWFLSNDDPSKWGPNHQGVYDVRPLIDPTTEGESHVR